MTAQFLITSASLHWETFENIIKSEPTLVFYNGDFLKNDMKAVRVTEKEIYSAIRQQGIVCLNDVYAVVLETNGVMSVIAHKDDISLSTLEGIQNYEPST